MAWVDCLIFDSADWPEPEGQFAILEKARRRREPRKTVWPT